MTATLSIGVMGAGSIGCFVGGLLASGSDVKVTLVGRRRLFNAIEADGLEAIDLDGRRVHLTAADLTLAETPDALAACDVVLFCTKSAQAAAVADALAPQLNKDTLIVSLQNGVRNPGTLRARLPQTVLAGVVEFNARWSGPARFERTTNGPLVVEKSDHPRWARTAEAFRAAGLELDETDDVESIQWTKLIVNLNNAVSALSGAPTPTMLTSDYRLVIAAIAEEGIRVVRAAGNKPGRFRGVPISLMPRILRLPVPLVRLLTRAQLKASADARSSMWEDLDKRRSTEVDYLNGEIVDLAKKAGVEAPINAGVVKLIKKAETAANGPPNLPASVLLEKLGLR